MDESSYQIDQIYQKKEQEIRKIIQEQGIFEKGISACNDEIRELKHQGDDFIAGIKDKIYEVQKKKSLLEKQKDEVDIKRQLLSSEMKELKSQYFTSIRSGL